MKVRALFTVVLFVLAFVLAACGGSEDGSTGGKAQEEQARGSKQEGFSAGAPSGPTPLETVQVAYKKTIAAETSKVAYEGVVTGLPKASGGPSTMRYTGEGVMDYAEGAAAMTIRMPMLGEMEVRTLGSVGYMRFPEMPSGQMFGGKPWAKIDMDKVAKKKFGASFSEMQGASATPEEQLGYLRGASDSVKELGQETVRGAPTTHYRAVVDLGKAAAAEEDPWMRRAYEKMDGQIGDQKMPVDVWLDGDDRVRRMEMVIPVADAAAGTDVPEDAEMTVVYEYYDFGAPVRVVPPPPGQTVDITDMALQGASAASAASAPAS